MSETKPQSKIVPTKEAPTTTPTPAPTQVQQATPTPILTTTPAPAPAPTDRLSQLEVENQKLRDELSALQQRMDIFFHRLTKLELSN